VESAAGRRRPPWRWLLLAVAVLAAGIALVMATGDNGGSGASSPCSVVLRGAQEYARGERSQDSLLQLVREQEPRADAEAARDSAKSPVADAVRAVRVELEAGPRLRSVVVLDDICG
jgi:hypothetical protein